MPEPVEIPAPVNAATYSAADSQLAISSSSALGMFLTVPLRDFREGGARESTRARPAQPDRLPAGDGCRQRRTCFVALATAGDTPTASRSGLRRARFARRI